MVSQSFPPPGDLPDLGTEPGSSALQVDSLPSEPPGKMKQTNKQTNKQTDSFYDSFSRDSSFSDLRVDSALVVP